MKSVMFRKFTLIELLVVIAIIGLLMTILLPSINNARKAGLTAVSISNLKQIYTGVITYSESNRGFIFLSNNNPHEYSNNGANFARLVYESIQGRVFGSNASQEMRTGPYKDLMSCPLIRQTREDIDFRQQGASDYSMNKYFRSYRHLAQINGGEKEPLISPSTAINRDRAVPSLRNGSYNPTANGHPVFEYYNLKSLGLYINGTVKSFSMSEGANIDSLISEASDFE